MGLKRNAFSDRQAQCLAGDFSQFEFFCAQEPGDHGVAARLPSAAQGGCERQAICEPGVLGDFDQDRWRGLHSPR